MDIFHDHRKYLALSWDFGKGHTRYFQFTVLPFGLSSAPFIFTKLLKPLETHWRSQAIRGEGGGRLIYETDGDARRLA